jgi:IS5 family transposase
MRQQTFAEGAFELYAKPTRRAAFLAGMERVVPWSELCAVIAPYSPKGEGGRPTVGLTRMLRIYCLQQWFNLSDPAAEEALYDSVSMRRFVGIDLGREAAPSSTKNKGQKRDPDMHEIRKGNQWHFGMKAHIGVACQSKIIHSVVATPANVADSQVLPELLHGQETSGASWLIKGRRTSSGNVCPGPKT